MLDYSSEQLEKLGAFLKGVCDSHINDRKLLETQWLINLRQHRRVYDPSVAQYIQADKSHSYPGDTRRKIKGSIAKMMEMMFPSQDKNWTLAPSPNPSIPKDELDNILAAVQQDPDADPQADKGELVERAIRDFAKKRAELMEAEINDQLSDAGVDFPQLCKRAVRSGYIYGPGIVRCPQVRKQKVRHWRPNEQTGMLESVEETVRRPYPEFVRCWDFYPDLSAKEWTDQEVVFERFVLARNDVRALTGRPDFLGDRITEYLKDHTNGNYVEKAFEIELREISKTANIADKPSRRYELYRALGFVSGHQLAACGIELTPAELSSDLFVELWLIDNVVIKAAKAAFGSRPSDQYHAFIYSEDEDSGITGLGLPEEIRDSQMGTCVATRILMDNMAATAGPILEVNEDLLPRGRKTIGSIHAFKVIHRTGDGPEAQYPAVREINTTSHIPEILNVLTMQRQQLDIESNLPDYAMGAMQQPLGEAFRTSNNMSMMLGSANMVTKDVVRSFDKFITSLIRSMLQWNMQFNPNELIKGDFEVVAKGNLSLVAKEVRGAALDQFMQSLTPEERAMLDTYGLLIDRLKARDLPTDRVIPKDEAMKVLASMQESSSAAAKVEQDLTTAKTEKERASAGKLSTDTAIASQHADAAMQEIMSRVDANLANAGSAKDRNQLENLKVLLSTLGKGGQDGTREQSASGRRRPRTAA